MAHEIATLFGIEYQPLNDRIAVNVAQVPIGPPNPPWLGWFNKRGAVAVVNEEIAVLAIGQIFDNRLYPFLGNSIQRACHRIDMVNRCHGELKITFELLLAGFKDVAFKSPDFGFGQSFSLRKDQP